MLRTAAALCILAASVALAMSFDRPEIRFGSAGNSKQCLANQIINMPSDVDVLLLGSSRLRRGVAPHQMTDSLGPDTKAYNLGRPGFSTPRNYVLLRELFARGARPSVVVVEAEMEAMRGVFKEKRIRRRFSWAADTAAVLSYRDMLDIPRSSFDAGLLGQFAFAGTGMLHKIEQGIARTLSGEQVSVTDTDTAETVCMMARFDAPSAKGAARRARKQQRFEENQSEIFGDLDTAVDDRFDFDENSFTRTELAYLQRIRELVAAHDAKLLVIRLFRYRSPPISTDVRAKLSELVPEQVSPPDAIYRQAGRLFADTSHFDPQGREIYTRWLSGEIAKVMADK